jgi:hypothetical protein
MNKELKNDVLTGGRFNKKQPRCFISPNCHMLLSGNMSGREFAWIRDAVLARSKGCQKARNFFDREHF